MTTKIEGITIEQLQQAYRIAAEIVALYGDAYLPVFQRLHNEMEKVNQREEIKSVALKMASVSINSNRRE